MKEAGLLGYEGENTVALLLASRGIPFIHDIYLKVDNVITQIDFMVVLKTGIYCLEVKNYNNCLIKGNLECKTWTANYYGRYEGFYNPYMQNLNHIAMLKKCLTPSSEKMFIRNFVVFNDEANVNINNATDEICRYSDLDRVLKEDTKYYYSDDEVKKYINELKALREKGHTYRLESIFN